MRLDAELRIPPGNVHRLGGRCNAALMGGLGAAVCSKAQAEQSRRCMPSRKVRTSKGRVVGNADPGKPAGKCHRNNPPMSAVPRERPTGKGEMVR